MVDRQIAAEDCIRGNIYDFAASGLDEAAVTRAARSECDDLERDYVFWGYDEYRGGLKPEDRAQAETADQWRDEKRGELGDVAHNAFVEAKAGQCWAHREWKDVQYEPGTI